MAKRKPSEQSLFERWYAQDFFLTLDEVRVWRTEHGYSWHDIDIAWMAWQARAKVNST